MRAGAATAVFLFAMSAASAADLPLAPAAGGYGTYYSGGGHRAGYVAVYGAEPGVVVRAYWRSPWRGRHYFPTEGGRPVLGRDEDLSVAPVLPEPSESFHRSWSTMPNLRYERTNVDARRYAEPPLPEERFSK